MVQELFRGPLLERLLARTPLVVSRDPVRGAAIARREDRQPDLRAVAKGVQDGAQHMPRHLPVGPELGPHLVQPCRVLSNTSRPLALIHFLP
jgi:hypothetical protein